MRPRSALVIGVLLSAAAQPRALPIKSGLELGNLDLSVRPQDDLYRYVYLRQGLLTLPHAPYEYRANGSVSHLPGFYEAFGVSAGDGLYRPPASRARVW